MAKTECVCDPWRLLPAGHLFYGEQAVQCLPEQLHTEHRLPRPGADWRSRAKCAADIRCPVRARAPARQPHAAHVHADDSHVLVSPSGP